MAGAGPPPTPFPVQARPARGIPHSIAEEDFANSRSMNF